MSRKPRWTEAPLDRGVKEIRLAAWRWFSDYVNQELLDYTGYIYRGHGDSSWKLEPTLDRVIRSQTSEKRAAHLNTFQHAVRGRRGSNPPRLDTENDWWALGQHNGLLSPLLDWTESPFVALYFAMVSAQKQSASLCCVWALHQQTVVKRSNGLTSNASTKPIDNRMPIVEFVRPMSDENSRLVNQRGLFTRAPNNVPVEKWIQDNNVGGTDWDLIKIVMPKAGGKNCLRYLNRMNINHATLFPDLYGASQFCNMNLQIPDY